MDRPLFPIAGSLNRGLVVLAGSWAIGATGAVGAKTGGAGLTLTRNGVGDYTLTYDKCNACLYAKAEVTRGTTSELQTQTKSKSGSSSNIICFTGTNTAADPSNGDTLSAVVVLLNASP